MIPELNPSDHSYHGDHMTVYGRQSMAWGVKLSPVMVVDNAMGWVSEYNRVVLGVLGHSLVRIVVSLGYLG